MSLGRRVELCAKFGYTCQWEEAIKKHTGETTFELESPKKKDPVGKVAEVGGECFFSSIYYLLVGKKSVKNKRRKKYAEKKKYLFFLKFRPFTWDNFEDRHNASEAKKCKAIRTGAMEVAKSLEFKKYCRATLGTAMSDFLPHECSRATVAITENAVRVNP